MNFKDKESRDNFKADYASKMEEASKKNEGVKLSKEKYLFDADMDDDGDEGVFLRGWVKWALGNDAMEEFIRNYLRPLGLVSLKCTYEETGCLLYGEFTYEDDQLFDTFLPQDDAFWEDEDNWDNDHYYDNLQKRFEENAETESVACFFN